MKAERREIVCSRASAAAATLYPPVLRSETSVCSRNRFSLALEIMFCFLLSAIAWPFIIHCTRSTLVFPMDLLRTRISTSTKSFPSLALNAIVCLCARENERVNAIHRRMLIDFFFGCRFALIWKLDTVLRTERLLAIFVSITHLFWCLLAARCVCGFKIKREHGKIAQKLLI